MSLFKSLSSGGSSNWADDEIDIPQPAQVSSTPAQVSSTPVDDDIAAAVAPQEKKVESSNDGYLRNHKKQQEQYSQQEQEEQPHHKERPSAPLPEVAPFIAHVGNLPYTVTEEDLTILFKGLALETKKMRIPTDYQTNQPKGFAYVEFTDRESLVEALTRKGELVGERPVRIDVAVERKSNYQHRDNRESSSFRGGDYHQSSGSRRDYHEPRESRNHHHRGPSRNYGNNVDETSDGHMKDYFHRRTSAKSNDDNSLTASNEGEGSIERPKLKLLARSSEDTKTKDNTTTNAENNESRKSSIFGAAKPRDETRTKYSQKRKPSIDQVTQVTTTSSSTDENKMNKPNTSTIEMKDRRNTPEKSSEKKSWKRGGETEQVSSDRRGSNTKKTQLPRGGRGVGGKNHRQAMKSDEELMKQATVQLKKISTKVTNAFSCLDSESESDSDKE